jgi:membrane dipeptidase
MTGIGAHRLPFEGSSEVEMKRRYSIAALVVLMTIATVPLVAADEPEMLATVRQILREVPLVDGHNDLPWQYRQRVENRMSEIDISQDLSALEPALHTDIPRLRQGGVGGQFWSVYVPASVLGSDAVQAVIEQIDVVHRMSELYPDTFELARTAADVRRIHQNGKIASLIGVEGGHSIGNSLAVLRQLHTLGAGYMTLTHSSSIDWADSATDAPRNDGLSPFGREVIREMNRLGMLVDLSHVSPKTMHDAIDESAAPVIFSHSSARALTSHPRNVPDDVLKRVAENRGVVMVTFVPSFVSETVRQHGAARTAEQARLGALHPGEPDSVRAAMEQWDLIHPRPRATISDVADHIDHVRRVAGIDAVAIGGDLDGITATPIGLSTVADYPALLVELLRRGYTAADLRKIVGTNMLRVMEESEQVAARLQRERSASEAQLSR